MLPHPDEATLAELAQGTLSDTERPAIEKHLEACAECREVVASVLRALSPEETAGPRRGQVVGRFVVLEPIGAGAIGEVFSAWDSVLERAVALKWLYPALVGSEGSQLRERLLAEARALAKVQHPNTVAVFDVVEWGATHVIVMELVPHARTLRQAVVDKSWRDITLLYADAARGLAAAHVARVIHGDFKPDNVLLGDGRVRVCDFGLSRAMPVAANATADSRRSSVSGTPAYLSPERWNGAPAEVATDAWAFCVSLYEALAGQLPFVERDVEGRLAEVKKGPPAIATARRVPPALVALLQRGLSLEPSARFASMDELVHALDAITVPPRTWSNAMLAVFGGAALLVLGAVGLGVQQYRARCDDAGQPVANVWKSERRDALKAAFLKTQHPAAESVSALVLAKLDGIAAKLTQTRKDACVATTFRGDSDALLTLRNVCVARRLSDLDALAHVLETADAKTVERAPSAVESLSNAQGCFDAAILGSLEAPPANKRADVEAATKLVSEVRALRVTGRTKESAEAGAAAVAAAEKAEWPPVLADALNEWSNSLERIGKFDDARTHGLRGLTVAFEANDFTLAFAAAVGLGFLDGYDLGKKDAAEAWLMLARGLLKPAKLTGTSEELRADNIEATLLTKAGNHAGAAERWKRILTAFGDKPSINLARVASNYGSALRESGKAEEGLPWLEKSVRMFETLEGPRHPDVAAASNNLGGALGDLGRFAEARPWFEKSLEIREQLFGKDAPPLATSIFNLGELALRTGDYQAALKNYSRSRAILDEAAPGTDDVWEARLGEGLSQMKLERWEDTATTLGLVAPELEKRKFPAHHLAEAKLGLALALKKLGREPQQVKQLATEVKALPGDELADQRARAEELLKP
ncbi:MAG: tetratricopeptide repeat protein [Archangium sp.]|nr:tetratricopeptide repeat protein [Archangium sp.]